MDTVAGRSTQSLGINERRGFGANERISSLGKANYFGGSSSVALSPVRLVGLRTHGRILTGYLGERAICGWAGLKRGRASYCGGATNSAATVLSQRGTRRRLSAILGASRVRATLARGAMVATLMPNNAFERTVGHRGPRLAAARSSWPAAQLGR